MVFEDFVSSPPTSGKYQMPFIIYANSHVTGGNLGWVLTTPGTANNNPWATSTAYKVGDTINANGLVYQCVTAGTSASSGAGPSGTGTVSDGTVAWSFLDTLAVFSAFGLISM